jgi:hypothetical protein
LRIAALILDRQARTVKPLELKIGIISHSRITAQCMFVICEAIAVYIHLLLYCRYIFLGGGILLLCLFKLLWHILWKFFLFRKKLQNISGNPSKTAVKKEKEEKEPKGAAAM